MKSIESNKVDHWIEKCGKNVRTAVTSTEFNESVIKVKQNFFSRWEQLDP